MSQVQKNIYLKELEQTVEALRAEVAELEQRARQQEFHIGDLRRANNRLRERLYAFKAASDSSASTVS